MNAPAIGLGTFSGTIVEELGIYLISSTFSFSDGDSGETHDVAVNFASASGAGSLVAPLGVLTANVTDAATGPGDDGQVTWSYSVDNSALQFLGEGDTRTETFSILLYDDQGGSVTQTITVTLTGTNDLPTLSAIVSPGAVAEVAGDSSQQDLAAITGTLSVSDIDVGDVLTASIVGSPVVEVNGAAYTLPTGATGLANALTFTPGTSNGGSATVGWSYDPAAVDLDFLAEGETLTLTYTVKVNDGTTDTGTQTLVISITGGNDGPTSIGGTVTGGATETPNANGTQGLAINGSFTATDLDASDTLTAAAGSPTAVWSNTTALPNETANIGTLMTALSTALTLSPVYNPATNVLTVDWSYAASDSLDMLAAGETITLTYPVTITDGTGATTSRDVVITITGSNDAPTIFAADVTGSFSEAASGAQTLAASGSFMATDLDQTDLLTAVAGTATAVWSGGGLPLGVDISALLAGSALTLAPGYNALTNTLSVNWGYSASADLNWLDSTETLTVTFPVTVSDGKGGNKTQNITLTITGANDAPTISPFAAPDTTEDAGVVSIALLQGAEDVDGEVLSVVPGITATSSNALRTVIVTQPGPGLNAVIDPAQFNDLDAGESETITLNYAISDGSISVPNTVTLLVQGQNDVATITVAPVADVAEADASTPVTINIASLVTITDPDTADSAQIPYVADSGVVSTTSTLVPPTGTLLGRVSLTGGVVSYDRADFNWLDDGESVTYTVQFDAKSGNDDPLTKSFTFTITGANDAPVIAPIAGGNTNEDVAAGGFSVNLLAGASDVDGEAVSYVAGSAVATAFGGTRPVAVSVDANGVLTLDLNQFNDLGASEVATVTVQYQVTDGTTPVSNTATFNVAGRNDAPEQIGTITPPADYIDPTTPLTTAGANSTTDVLFAASGSGFQGTRGGTLSFTDADAADVLDVGVYGGALVEAADIHAIRAAAVFTYTNASGVTFTSSGLNTNLTPQNGAIPFTGGLTIDDRADILNAFDIHSASYNPATNRLDVVWSFDNTSTGTTGIAGVTIDNNVTPGLPLAVGSVDADWLTAGETLKVEFPVTVTDGAGGTLTVKVPFTFVGARDNPTGTQVRSVFLNEGGGNATFTTAGTGAAVDNDFTTAGTDNGFAGGVHTVRVDDGTASDNQIQRISFNDPDRLDTVHTLSATTVTTTTPGAVLGTAGVPDAATALGWLTPSLTQRTAGAAGNINWTFTAPDTAFDYLGAGDTLTLVYQLNLTDADGLSTLGAGRTVTVTITGTNDGPALAEITPPTAVAESAGSSAGQNLAAITGTLSVTDLDRGDALTASVVGSPEVKLDGVAYTLPGGAAALVAAGALSFAGGTSNGGATSLDWTYDPAAADLDFLAEGEVLTLAYTVKVNDGTADSATTQVLTISITGTNDQPIISLGETGSDAEDVTETDAALSTSGTLKATDLDVTDGVTASVTAATVDLASTYTGPLPGGIDLQSMLTVDTLPVIDNANTTGTIHWAFNSGSQAFDFLADGETLILNYTVAATDDSGTATNAGTKTVTVTITGSNDGPVAVNDTVGGAGSEVYETATLNVLAAAGVLANDSDVDDNFTVTGIQVGTSGTVGTVGTALTGLHGALTLNSDGSYDYVANRNDLALGENATDTFTYTITDEFGDEATATLAITITGQNDRPVLSAATSTGALAETAGQTGNGTVLSAIGSFTATDVDTTDLAAVSHAMRTVVAADVTGVPATAAQLAALNGLAAKFAASLTASGSGGTVNWAFTPTDGDLDFLRNGQTATLKFDVTVKDDSGETATESAVHTVTVTLTGANDTVIIFGAANDFDAAVTEDASATTLTNTGTFQVQDADLSLMAPAVITRTGGTLTGGTGTLTATITPTSGNPTVRDVAWTYTVDNSIAQYLAHGQTATETFNVRVLDSVSGGFLDRTVTATITGNNDAPVISVEAGDSDSVPKTETDAALTASGTLTVTDVDVTDVVTANITGVTLSGHTGGLVDTDVLSFLSLATHTDLTAGTATSGSLGWSFNSAPQAFNFLDADDSLTLAYTVKVADNATGEATRVVTITITGTDDAPVVTGDFSGGATEDAGLVGSNLVVTGLLTAVDPDHDQSGFQPTTTPLAGTYGNLMIDAAGAWTYTAANSGVQGLDVDAGATETFTVKTIDGTERTITINLTGVNDAPVAQTVDWNAGPMPQPHATEDAAVNGSFTAILPSLASDADDTLTAASFSIGDVVVDGVTFTAAAAGITYDTGTGAFTFDPVGNALYQSLNAGDVAVVVVNFTVTDDNTASNNGSITFRVDGVNDIAAITGSGAGADAGSVSEDVSVDVSGNLVASGNLSVADADDGEAKFRAETLTSGAGSLSIDATGAWTFTIANSAVQDLDDGEQPTLTFTVSSLDGSATKNIVITLNGANDAPLAADVSGSTDEDTIFNGSVLATDVDGEALTYALVGTAPAEVTFNPDGSFSVAPIAADQAFDTGEYREVTFQYVANDSTVDSAAKTVTITINGANDAPVADDVTGSTDEDTTFNGSVSATDVDSEALTYALVGTAPDGVTFSSNGSFSVAPLLTDQALDTGGSRQVTFQYVANDGTVNSAPKTVTITINGANDTPVVDATIADQSVNEDTAWSFAVPAGTFSDVDAGEVLAYSAQLSNGDPLPAWLTFNSATLTFTGTPPLNTSPVLEITVKASDGELSASDTFTLSVIAQNDAPVANSDQVTLNENVGTTLDVVSNDTDVENDPLTVQSLATLTLADVTGLAITSGDLATLQGYFSASGGSIVFAPGAGLPGGASLFDRLEPGETATIALGYTIADGNGGTASAVATFTINGLLENPVTATPNDDLALNGTIYGDMIDGLAGDDVINGLDGADTLIGGLGDDSISGGSHDDVITGGAGDDTIAGGSGVDTLVLDKAWAAYTITFTVSTGTFTITDTSTGEIDVVTGIEKVTFADGTVDVRSSAPGVGPAAIVTANAPSVVSVLSPRTGTAVSVDEDSAAGTVVAVVSIADANLAGLDTLGFSLVDAMGAAYVGPFSIVQTGPAQAEIRVAGGLDHETAASHALTVRIEDSTGRATTQAVTVAVTDLNDTAPVITAAPTANVSEGTTSVLGVSVTDADTVGGPVTLSLGGADAALFVIDAGQLKFASAPDFEAPADQNADNDYEVTLIASDTVNTTQQAVLVTVTDANDPVTGAPTTVLPDGAEDVPYTVTEAQLLAGFDDADGDALLITSLVASSGSVTDNGDGTYTITPALNAHGPVTLTYDVSDGNGSTVTGQQLSYVVTPVNDAPVAGAPIVDQHSQEDMPVAVMLPAGLFTDPDDGMGPSPLSLTATLANGDALPAWLTFLPIGDTGSFSGMPPANFNGTLSLKVTATDAGGLSASQTFALTIDPVNDAPVISTVLTNQSSDEDASINVTLPADAFTDPDGETLALTASVLSIMTPGLPPITNPAGEPLPAWLSFNAATGAFTGTPPANFNGSLTLKVTATDAAGLNVSQTFVLDITPVNDAPVVGAVITDQHSPEDMPISVMLPADVFTDPDDVLLLSSLSLTATLANGDALPAWLTFMPTPGGGMFFGTPPANFNGTLSLKVTATDGDGLANAQTFALIIDPVNDAPAVLAPLSFAPISDNQTLVADLLQGATDVDEATVLSVEVTGVSALTATLTSITGTTTAALASAAGFASVAAYEAALTAAVTAAIAGGGTLTLNANSFAGFNALEPGQTASITLNYRIVDSGAPQAFTTQTADISVNGILEDIPGGPGADTLVGTQWGDLAQGFESADLIQLGNGNDTALGGGGGDNIYGGTGNDLLKGEAGHDNFDGGLGADTIEGGEGSDSMYYTQAVAGVRADLANLVSGLGEAAGDVFSSIDNLIGSQYADTFYGTADANVISALGGDDLIDGRGGDDYLYGGAGRDNLYGGTGVDRLYGDADSDNLEGGAGADYLDGGAGFDVAYYGLASASVRVDLTGAVAATGDAAGDSFASIEGVVGSGYADMLYGDGSGNVILGQAGDDLLHGRGGSDHLYGGAGLDNIYGGDDADALYGELGNDNLDGGAGGDVLNGGDGFDMVYYSAAAASITADLANLTAGAGEAAGDIFTSMEGVVGSQSADTLLGDGNDNVIHGQGGGDTITGRGGNDYLYGGSGNDAFVFQTGFGKDTIGDFVAGVGLGDILDISMGAAFDTFAEVLAAATQQGTDTVITFDANTSIRLTGVQKSALVADDVRFS